ncbi:MAG: hypothetical protein AB7O67_18450 [Vicinamibacterales bacterium]
MGLLTQSLLFTSSQDFVVPAAVTRLFVQVQGAGGTGGDADGAGIPNGFAGGGGGGGGYVQAVVDVTPGDTMPVVVGGVANGGNASCGGGFGITGGASSFAGLVGAGGGGGGRAFARSAPGVGGGGGTMSGSAGSFFGGAGQAGGPVIGGAGGAPGSAMLMLTPAYGAGGQGSSNCGVTTTLAMPGFVRVSW